MSWSWQLNSHGVATVNCSRASCPDLPCEPGDMEHVNGSCCAQCRPPSTVLPLPTPQPGVMNEGSLQTLEEQRNSIIRSGGCVQNNVRVFWFLSFIHLQCHWHSVYPFTYAVLNYKASYYLVYCYSHYLFVGSWGVGWVSVRSHKLRRGSPDPQATIWCQKEHLV